MSTRILRFAGLFCLLAATVQAGDGVKFIKNLEAKKKQHLVVYGTSLTAAGAWPDLLKEALDRKYPGLVTLANGACSGQWSQWGV